MRNVRNAALVSIKVRTGFTNWMGTGWWLSIPKAAYMVVMAAENFALHVQSNMLVILNLQSESANRPPVMAIQAAATVQAAVVRKRGIITLCVFIYEKSKDYKI